MMNSYFKTRQSMKIYSLKSFTITMPLFEQQKNPPYPISPPQRTSSTQSKTALPRKNAFIMHSQIAEFPFFRL